MNAVKKWKVTTRQARKEGEIQLKLSAIPRSSHSGIAALPVELWGIILEHVVTSQLDRPNLQCWEVSDILNYRLVCRVFSREIPHSLHQHILVPQIPRLALMRTLIHSSYFPQAIQPTPLLASAILNSARVLFIHHHRFAYVAPRIAHRIRNCSIIASHISHPPVSQSLLQRLSTAASTSIYAQEYIYMPSYYEQLFQSKAEGDACLEVALLSVCGYDMEDVVKTMVRLVRRGVLRPYAWGKYEWEVRRKRRWASGVGQRKYGRADLAFLGGRSLLW